MNTTPEHTPDRKPLGKDQWDKIAVQTQESRRDADAERREKLREKERAIAARYDPNVIVVIEFVSPDRDQVPQIIWNIGGRLYGFYPRKRLSGLEPWQERVPASAGLPKVDARPDLWRLIHDPRQTAPPLPVEAEDDEALAAVRERLDATNDAAAAELESEIEQFGETEEFEAAPPEEMEDPAPLSDEDYAIAIAEGNAAATAEINHNILNLALELLESEILTATGKIKKNATDEQMMRRQMLREMLGLI